MDIHSVGNVPKKKTKFPFVRPRTFFHQPYDINSDLSSTTVSRSYDSSCYLCVHQSTCSTVLAGRYEHLQPTCTAVINLCR